MRDKLSTYFCRLKDVLQDDWQYEKAGCLILFVAILCILILPCVLAYYIPFEQCCWWNIFEKFISEHSLFTSVMGTFIGVIIIFVAMRPRMRIDKKMMTLKTGGDLHLKVRIRNLGLFPINNVDVQLLYYREVLEDGKIVKHTKKLELLRSDSPVVRGIYPPEADPTYGCATLLTISKLKEARKLITIPDQEYEGILCRVKATHAISGVTYVREYKFEKVAVDEFFQKHCNADEDKKDSIAAACSKINNDVKEVNEQMKDIQRNVEIIQKENKKNQKKMKRISFIKTIGNWFKRLFASKKQKEEEELSAEETTKEIQKLNKEKAEQLSKSSKKLSDTTNQMLKKNWEMIDKANKNKDKL